MNSDHRKKILVTALPIAAALVFLWFPFDWLSEVWPAFGVPFRILFHDQRSHLVGHAIFFFLIGLFVLFRLPSLQRKPLLYACGVILAAVVQETIQAMFRQQMPRFDDFNAFKGDVFGAMSAFALSSLLQRRIWSQRSK
jgi:hypothetical protein